MATSTPFSEIVEERLMLSQSDGERVPDQRSGGGQDVPSRIRTVKGLRDPTTISY